MNIRLADCIYTSLKRLNLAHQLAEYTFNGKKNYKQLRGF